MISPDKLDEVKPSHPFWDKSLSSTPPATAKVLLEKSYLSYDAKQLCELACTSFENAKFALNNPEILNRLGRYDANYVPVDEDNPDETKTGWYLAKLAIVFPDLMPNITNKYRHRLLPEIKLSFEDRLREIAREIERLNNAKIVDPQVPKVYRGGRE